MALLRSLLRRRLVRLGLVVVTSGGGLALFLLQAHPRELCVAVDGVPPGAVAAALAAGMIGVALSALRWRVLLAAGGVEATASKAFAALTAGAAVNNVVPARGGDAVRVESAHRLTGAPRLAVAGTLLSERILDGLVLALLVAAGALGAGGAPVLVWSGSGLAAAIALGAFALHRFGGRLRGRLDGLRPGLAIFGRRLALPALGVSLGIWLADVVMYASLVRGFDLDVSLAACLLLVGAGNLALAIPGTAGGLGSFELVTIAGAHGIGVGGGELAAFVLAVHAVIVLPTTVAGLVLARVAFQRAPVTAAARP